MGPRPDDWCLCKKRRGHRKTHGEECHVKKETEMGVILSQAKECERPPGVE